MNPVCANRSIQLIWLCLSIHLPVYLSFGNPRLQNWLISFFWKSGKAQFLEKKSHWVRRAQKVPTMAPKWGFWGFDKKLILSYVLEYESTFNLLTFCKTPMSGKNLVLRYVLKSSRLIIMQDSLNHNISQMSWGMKCHFCVCLDMYKTTNWWNCFKWVCSGMHGHA